MDSKLSDTGCERAVLAGLLAYGTEAYVEISDFITEESFSHPNNQILYKCIVRVLESNDYVDFPTILSAAEQLKLTEYINSKEELEYIKNLIEFPVKKETIPYFASQIKKFEFARKVKRISQKISSEIEDITGNETIDEIISIIEKPLTDFLRGDDISHKPEQLGDNIEEYLQFLIDNKCDQIGLSTGFPRYDAVIGGGLRRKCVDLIAARPGIGKSVYADSVALHNARKGIKVLMLDTEMSKEDHLNRILASLSGVSINDIATGKFSEKPEFHLKLKSALQEIKNLPYTYVSVAGMPFENILNIIKRWILKEVGQDDNGKTNDCLVIYDYLKLMSSASISNHIQEYQALGFQITDLHNLTVKYDFPCLSFVQLNRDGITKESTDAVSGSDRLLWLCTSLSIFKLKSPEELAEDGPNAGNRKLVNLKARHGSGLIDGNYINMNMVGSLAKLIELKTRDENKNYNGDLIEGSELPFDKDDREDDMYE